MIILPCLYMFIQGGYLTYVFILALLFSGIFALIRP